MNIVRNTLKRVELETGFAAETMLAKRRRGPCELARARWLAWRRLRELGWSYPRIARAFGGVHHTTVLHGVRRLGEIGA